jgi:hypothetical protein
MAEPLSSLTTLGCTPASQARVAQVVEADAGQSGAVEVPVELPADMLGVQ